MTADHDEHQDDSELPADTIAVLRRDGQDRMYIGAYEHPDGQQHLSKVTIHTRRDGKQTDGFDFDLTATIDLITALLEAISICWHVSPDEAIVMPGGPRDPDPPQ